MMKNSTLFIVKKFKSNSVVFSQLSEKASGKSSEEMKSAGYNPSAQTIRKILDFSRAYDVIKTEKAGQVEMILN